jgi:hypothetical protein
VRRSAARCFHCGKRMLTLPHYLAIVCLLVAALILMFRLAGFL